MISFSAIIGDMVSKITSKAISSKRAISQKSMIEISTSDCGAVAGGPQIRNQPDVE